jgi:hypothetical protein
MFGVFRCLTWLSILVLSVAVAGCGLRRSTAHTSQPGMSCREATRVARGALLRLGYMIDRVEPAKPGAPGLVTGRKEMGWAPSSPEAGDVHTAEIRITCSDRGAEFEGVADVPFGSPLEFGSELPQTIAKLAEQRTERPRLEGHPEGGMVIEVVPLRGVQARSELGIDPTPSGVTPVRLRLENRTERSYVFERSKVTLVSQDGARSQALPVDRVAATFGDSVGKTLCDRLIAEGEVAPHQTLSGFLYFPAAAYQRATLLLTDQSSDEPEGFSVEF